MRTTRKKVPPVPGREISGSLKQKEDAIIDRLLDRIRRMTFAFQRNAADDRPNYAAQAKHLSDILESGIYLLTGTGKLLAAAWDPRYGAGPVMNSAKEGYVSDDFVTEIERCFETGNFDGGAMPERILQNASGGQHLLLVPICGSAGTHLGVLALVRLRSPFRTADILLAEYLAIRGGLEMLNERSRDIESHSRDSISVRAAMRVLSYSEIESMRHIVSDLNGSEGVVITSKTADRIGVTRSVIVNALRKLESAGLVESRSLGMRGTYIKILNPCFIEELRSPTSPQINYGHG